MMITERKLTKYVVVATSDACLEAAYLNAW